MAKYKLSDKKSVNCEILNESADEYIVRFKNDIIRNVSKSKVYDLDTLDEGVLDALKQSAAGIKRYGRKFTEKLKDATKKVKEFFAKVFTVRGFVLFRNEDNEIISASHPVNAMEGAKMSDCVNFIPGEGTIELCKGLEISPRAIENFVYDGAYDGAMQFIDYKVNESNSTSSSLIDAIFEDENTRLNKGEKINLEGTFCDFKKDDIVDTIYEEWVARCAGVKPKILPLLIWGAPGIGKTAIIRSLEKVIKQNTGESINIISVNGGNVGPDDFTMPAKIAKFIRSNDSNDTDNDDFKGATKTVIKDLPKSWLPVWDATEDRSEWERLNAIANGGRVIKDENGNEVIENGPGGIFFIDEYSRMTPAGMDSLMQTPTTREIGSSSSLRFGDRWVIVCAANRKSDMSRRGGSESLMFEGASKTRFNHCNFVPEPEDWLAWAEEYSDTQAEEIKPTGTLTQAIGEQDTHRRNVLPEITNYIRSEIKRDPKTGGDFYEMYSVPTGELSGDKASACPRTWEAASWALYLKLKFARGKHYTSVSAMPKERIVHWLAGILGADVAKRFATFVSQYSVFTTKDAENVWTRGDDAKYEIIKQQKLNSANIEETFKEHIIPMLRDNYPGGIQDGVSPEAALNFIKFLEACCYDGGKFNLNRFKTISALFALEFGVDMKSVNGPYADAANYKEDVVAKNEIV